MKVSIIGRVGPGMGSASISGNISIDMEEKVISVAWTTGKTSLQACSALRKYGIEARPLQTSTKWSESKGQMWWSLLHLLLPIMNIC